MLQLKYQTFTEEFIVDENWRRPRLLKSRSVNGKKYLLIKVDLYTGEFYRVNLTWAEEDGWRESHTIQLPERKTAGNGIVIDANARGGGQGGDGAGFGNPGGSGGMQKAEEKS